MASEEGIRMSNPADSQPIGSKILATRTELEETLNEISDRLNLPKRVGRLTAKARASIHEDPVPWIAAVTAVVVALGAVVAWAIFKED